MVIEIIVQNMKISEKTKTAITQKFTAAIEKYLNGVEEDLKVATLTMQKMPRFGYSLKFDMQLPWTHIYARQNSPLLFVGIVGLRERVKRQIREESEKVKEKRK